MNKYSLVIGAIVVVALVGWWLGASPSTPGGQKACTMEAKLCPDGSAVGRTGPNCEFAECSSIPATPTSATTTLAFGEKMIVNGVIISPRVLAEDSRCPVDVQCIQAGTVRVGVAVDGGDVTFKLGVPQVVGNMTITLVSVTPAEKHSKVTIPLGDYKFTLTLVPNATTSNEDVTVYHSGVRGVVSLGPTCPVQRIPPDPACADKPYATAITVYRTGSSAPFVVGNSNATGAFTFALPPGSYRLSASGGTTLPRCSDTSVNISLDGYTTTAISCDSGIR